MTQSGGTLKPGLAWQLCRRTRGWPPLKRFGTCHHRLHQCLTTCVHLHAVSTSTIKQQFDSGAFLAFAFQQGVLEALSIYCCPLKHRELHNARYLGLCAVHSTVQLAVQQ